MLTVECFLRKLLDSGNYACRMVGMWTALVELLKKKEKGLALVALGLEHVFG